MRRNWGELTTTDFGELVNADAVAVMVLGAMEQHGPHLPLATDSLIGEGLLDEAIARLDDEFPLLVLPSMHMTASPEHLGFPGTLSLSPEQARAHLIAVGQGVARTGLQRLVLVNAHGGNIGWMDGAALELRRRLGMLVVKASYMRFSAPADVLGAGELRDGLHGGLAETAMLRHLAPDRVRMDRAERFEALHPHNASLPPQGDAPWAWLAEDLNESGVVGDASAATPEIGRRLVDHYASRLAGILGDCRAKAWSTDR